MLTDREFYNLGGRRKRKWDKPAEQLVAAGVAFPQLLPLGNTMNVPSMSPLLQTLSVPLAVPKVNQVNDSYALAVFVILIFGSNLFLT